MNTHHHYLRLLRTFALATLTAAAVAACTDDNGDPAGRDPITPPDAADGIAVNFTANINPGSDADPAAAPGTRTVLTPDGNGGFTVEWKGQDTYADDCDWVRIWAAKDNTLAFRAGKAYVPTTSGVSSALVPRDDNKKLTLPSAGDWTFMAVYGNYTLLSATALVGIKNLTQSEPGNTGHIVKNDFSVATATQYVAADSDMPQSINLKFEHKFSALQLHVTNATGEALTVREIRFSTAGGQITYAKDYDVATWTADEGNKTDYLQLTIDAPAALASGGTESQDFHMLLFPEPDHGGKNMTITVITDRGEYTLTKPAPASPGFEAGHNYMTNITIKSSGLNPDTETWTETISNKAELAAFRDKVNGGNDYAGATVRLTTNIDLSGETWTPIGTSTSKAFSGTFDGGGYHISKLSVNTSEDYAGLFGYVYGGTVRNLRVSGTVTTTGYEAGGIAGYLNTNSTVENCIFEGNVSGNSDVGGIAGYSTGANRIAGCHTKGKVTTTATTSQNAGGIAGNNYGSTIDGCYSEAEVTAGNQFAGGIAGSNENGGTITHCYATGKVSGKSSVGGIVGYQLNVTLTGCIALNPGLTRTEGSATKFGRIVGLNQFATVNSCGAYGGMTLPDGVTVTSAADGIHGATLTREQCLTTATYTTTHGFPVADAATPGWAFDAATPWTYLPWNPAFASFPGITEADYKISVSTLGTN